MEYGQWTLHEIYVAVENDLLHLPAFQRKYQWDVGNAVDLIDSLFRSLPVGSLTLARPTFSIGVALINRESGDLKRSTPTFRYLEPEKFSEIAARASENLGRRWECHLVLDGQQRLTSLYRAMKGIDPIYVAFKDDNEEFHDLPQLSRAIDAVRGDQGSGRLHVPIHVAYRAADMSDDDLKEEFLKTAFAKDKTEDLRDAEGRRFALLARKIQTLFFAKVKIPYVLSEAVESDLILFFERSNTKGIPLSFFDLLNAKTFAAFRKTKHKSFSKALEEELKKVPPEFRVPKMDEHLTRALAFEPVRGRCGSKNPLAQGTILEFLTGEDIAEGFEHKVDEFAIPVAFLQKNKFTTVHDRVPFPLMVVPTFFFLKALGFKEDKLTKNQLEFFKWWYWASVFSERYSYRTNEAALEDIDILRKVAAHESGIIDGSYVANLTARLASVPMIQAITSGRGHFQRAILQLGIYLFDSQDLRSGDPLSSKSMTIDTKTKRPRSIDLHHIFPKAFLGKQGLSNSQIDVLTNIMYATPGFNRSDLKAAPSVYLDPEQKQHVVPSAMLTHFVSEEMLKDLQRGEYDVQPQAFFEKRAGLMKDAIDKVCGSSAARAQLERWGK